MKLALQNIPTKSSPEIFQYTIIYPNARMILASYILMLASFPRQMNAEGLVSFLTCDVEGRKVVERT